MLKSALHDLSKLLHEETNVSAYELNSSGLIQCFLKLFGSRSSAGQGRSVGFVLISLKIYLFFQGCSGARRGCTLRGSR